VSPDVRSVLILQPDGNLVDYSLGGQVFWASNTAGRPVKDAVMQSDGNFVLYFTDGSQPWSTETSTPNWKPGGSEITLQNDGNLVIYPASGVGATWASNGDGGKLTAANIVAMGSDRLWPGTYLYPSRFLRSVDGRYALLLQGDGNLVLYGPGYHVLWSSGTAGTPMNHGVLQGDGNFVLYPSDGVSSPWSTQTVGKGGVILTMQDDGNLVMYTAASTAVWQSGTSGKI
jgi:hypothetical protein